MPAASSRSHPKNSMETTVAATARATAATPRTTSPMPKPRNQPQLWTSSAGRRTSRACSAFMAGLPGSCQKSPRARLELLADHAVKRIGAAAAYGNGEHDDPQEQHVFEAALVGGEPLRHVHGQKSDAKLDGDRGGKKAREQADDDAKRADRFQEHRRAREQFTRH